MTLGRNTIMSLSRRNAASKSAKKAVARGSWFVARGSCEFPQFLVVGARTWRPLQIITTSKTGGLLRPYKGLTPVVAL